MLLKDIFLHFPITPIANWTYGQNIENCATPPLSTWNKTVPYLKGLLIKYITIVWRFPPLWANSETEVIIIFLKSTTSAVVTPHQSPQSLIFMGIFKDCKKQVVSRIGTVKGRCRNHSFRVSKYCVLLGTLWYFWVILGTFGYIMLLMGT